MTDSEFEKPQIEDLTSADAPDPTLTPAELEITYPPNGDVPEVDDDPELDDEIEVPVPDETNPDIEVPK